MIGSSNVTLDFESLHEEDAKHKFYWALLLIILPVLAIFGNILVIVSVYKEKSLQSVTNYFIVSLAFADLLVGGVVMPFALYFLVSVCSISVYIWVCVNMCVLAGSVCMCVLSLVRSANTHSSRICEPVRRSAACHWSDLHFCRTRERRR
jgi:dopamine D2-like receptor